MLSLKEHLINTDETINEGFLMNALTKRTVNKMSSDDLFTGIMNMYDYIVDQDDIKLFLKDFPAKERLFWKNLYDLYQKGVWSIFDSDIDTIKDFGTELIPEFNKVTEITPEFRRQLRQLIKKSKNSNLELKPSSPSDIMAVYDELTKTIYIFTINRVTGFRSVFRPLDKKFLVDVFNKIGESKTSLDSLFKQSDKENKE